MMSEPFLAQIVMFGGTFNPRGWEFCDGQLLAIDSNQAMYSLLGNAYGGDGRTDFGLPDLRGRVPVHPGNEISRGEKDGVQDYFLTTDEMPSHTHTVNAHGGGKGSATTDNPSGALPGDANSNIYATDSGTVTMSSSMIANNSGGQSFSIMQPYLAINFIIALEGTFPPRN